MSLLYVSAINLSLALLTALTLWLVWRKDKEQSFLQSFALMNLCSGSLMLAHLAWSSSQHLQHVAGSIGAPVFTAAHMVFGLRAVQQLRGNKPDARNSWRAFAVLLIAFSGILFAFNDQRIYSGIYGGAWLLIGLYAIDRLWHMGGSEKIIAPLMFCVALNTLALAAVGESWIVLLYSNSGILRVALAMSVMYCALSRSFNNAAASKARFEHLSQNARHGIVVCSAQKILYANPAALRIYGYASPEEAQQSNLFATVPDQHLAAAIDEVTQMLAGRDEFIEVQREARRLDGTSIYVNISGWRMEWDGQPALQLLISDETERQEAVLALKAQQEQHERDRAVFAESSKNALLKANNELEQRVAEKTEKLLAASQAKSQFLANMSHEIRTPMNVILGLLQLLQGTPQSLLQGDYTVKAQRAARSLLSLLNDLLDFSKIDAGKMDLERVPFEVERLLRDLSVLSAVPRAMKPVELLFDIDPAIPPVLVGDAMRLQQVLMNLTANAIKFTEQGEVVVKIRVKARSDERVTLHVAVQDTGIGISDENQKHIFDMFSQAEASTTRRFGGTGLGLSICRQLLSLMDSQLLVHSVPGQGSTFYFDIDLPLANLHDVAVPQSQPPAADSAGLPVLLVDDNAVALQLLATMARALGWQVDTAESGERAVEMVQARLQAQHPAYRAIVVDWKMGGLDGWDTLARIESMTPEHLLPATVMVSAYGRDQLTRRSADEQERLCAYLVKPVTMAMLQDAVLSARNGRGNMRFTTRPEVERQRRLDGLHLLLVEDNPLNQLVARELLSNEGATVQVANNGSLCVQALSQPGARFDLVLMDMQMPVMDGCSASHIIRKELGLGADQLPIIAMTANTMQSDRDACRAAGMNDHVSKPFDIGYLVDVIRRHTGREAAPQTAPATAVPKVTTPTLVAQDIHSAIADMGGDADLYQQILALFLQDLGQLEQQLLDMFQAGESLEALRLLHTIKGNAATVGAHHMSAVAFAAETELKAADAEFSYMALATRVAAVARTTAEQFTPWVRPVTA